MNRHEGKVVLITGAARGIGRTAATTFAGQGAEIVACDIGTPVSGSQSHTAEATDLEQTATAVRDLGQACQTFLIDVRSQDTLDAAVAGALDRFGRIDAVIANAGVMHSKSFWETSDSEWSTVLDINLSGVWRTAKAVAPHMIERRNGVIIATASVQAHSARKNLAAYTASKHGLLGLLKTLTLELGDHNIRVNSVLPGAVHTPMIDNDSAGRLGQPGEENNPRLSFFRKMSALSGRSALPPDAVANAMSWLVSAEAEHVTGVELPVDAGSLVLPGINFGTQHN